MDLREAAQRVQKFEGGALTSRLSSLEQQFSGLSKKASGNLCVAEGMDSGLLRSAFELKKLAGQINVVIHAAGILASLPTILDEGEVIEYLSLGAGNTGREFDLSTNRRVAEFKFINWKGGPESIRQNSMFKDFYTLAEHNTEKSRCLYVLGLMEPLKFLTGRRNLSSVMSKNAALASDFQQRYGERFSVMSEYYHYRKERVQLIDLIPLVPELAGLPAD